jgi:hypothetical protein
VPELGGWYDARNPSHKMLMSVLGGMSESERQHVQARVLAAIDAQVVNEGRHQGGRAPYGYTVVDGGPDPNPSGPPWVSGCGCWYWTRGRRRWWRGFSPSTWTGPGIERSRPGSTGTVSLPVGEPTGAEPAPEARRLAGQHGPGDLGESALHRLRGVRPLDQSGGAFADAGTSGDRVRGRVHSSPVASPGAGSRRDRDVGAGATRDRSYLLRGLVRCELCQRKMQGGSNGKRVLYRCIARQLAPGSAALTDHPKTINLGEKA